MPHPYSSGRRSSAQLWAGALALAALAAGVLVPGSAHAEVATEDPALSVGVGITPASVFRDLSERRMEFEATVFNNRDRPASITIEVVHLGHELDGTPTFGDPIDEVEVVEGRTSFTLDPGERQQLTLLAEFPDQVALYAGVLGTVETEDTVDAIGITTRFASLLVLRGPRPWDQSLDTREIGIDHQEGATEASLYVDVENIGNAHARPTGRFLVRDDGELIDEVELQGENILPGFARRLRGVWVPASVPDNEVELEVELDDGTSLTQLVGLGNIPAQVTQEREDQGLPTGARLEAVDPGVPPALSAVALVLLFTAIALLLVLWVPKKDGEDEDASPEAVAGASVDDDGG